MILSTLALLALSLSQYTDKCTVAFAGDMMQHKAQILSAFRDSVSYRYDDCFRHVKPEISKASLAICNLEAPLGGSPYTGYPTFSAPDEFAEAIADAGFDIMLTANNHCMDKGNRGLIRTLDVLDSLRILHLGTYRNKEERDTLHPLIVSVNSFRLALLNYTYDTNGFEVTPPCIVNLIDTVQMAADLEKARSKRPDCIIVCIHWGEEYHLEQNAGQERLARWLVDNGADHVIGSHPHVIQPTTLINDQYSETVKHIVAYSQGNFISNMSAPGTDSGTFIELSLTKIARTTWLSNFDVKTVRTLRPAQTGNPYYQVVFE